MRFAIMLCCLFFVGVPVAHAASASGSDVVSKPKMSVSDLMRWQKVLTQFTKHYDDTLVRVRRGSDQLDFDIRSMRHYYARSEYYMPFSKGILDEMTEYAYIVDTSEDKEEVNESLLRYKELVWAHLLNLDVLTFAITMSRVDPRYGDEILFKDVERALLKDILYANAKCEKPKLACRIVSYGEESYILGRIGGTLMQSKIYEVNGLYYNVHDLIKDGKEIQVYIDVTVPIVNVMKRQAVQDSGADVSIHPQ